MLVNLVTAVKQLCFVLKLQHQINFFSTEEVSCAFIHSALEKNSPDTSLKAQYCHFGIHVHEVCMQNYGHNCIKDKRHLK